MKQMKIDRENGMTLQQIADKHGVALSTAHKYIRRNGVDTSYKMVNKCRKHEKRRELVIKDGPTHTVKELVDKYGLTDRTIRGILRRNGIEFKRVVNKVAPKPVIKVNKERKKAEPRKWESRVREGQYRKVRVNRSTELHIYEGTARWNMCDSQITEIYNNTYAK